MMNRYFIAIAFFLWCAAMVCGQEGDWYLGQDGYYRRPGSNQAYYRTQTLVSAGGWSYGNCGRYYPPQYTYQYHAYVYPAPTTVPSYKPYNWQEDVTLAIKQRQDYDAYLAAIQTLQGGQRLSSYNGPYSMSGSGYHSTTYGANGSTLYGNSF